MESNQPNLFFIPRIELEKDDRPPLQESFFPRVRPARAKKSREERNNERRKYDVGPYVIPKKEPRVIVPYGPTDDELRENAKLMCTTEIAEKFGVGRGTISRRLKSLGIEACAALVNQSETYVGGALDAVARLTENVEKTVKLQEACDEWLRDAKDPSKYNIGPRSDEIDVTYEVEIETPDGYAIQKRRKPLRELLDAIEADPVDGARIVAFTKSESKYADPRELILKTAQEVRHTMSTAADITRTLADVRAMQAFRDAVLYEIGQADEETQQRIAQAVRRSIVLQGISGGLETLAPA